MPDERGGLDAESQAGGFTDRFAPVAAGYAAFRPRYPDALFAWLAERAPARGLAWECGAGSGQATASLAAHFARVVATDASPAQVARARPHPRVTWHVATAEASGLPDECADCIAVAQAAHWFDLPAFFDEARRVGRPRALVALWTYNLLESGDATLDAAVERFYRVTLAGYWSPERRLVDDSYRTIDFPFAELAAPRFDMHARWTLPHLLGYLRTWSAVAAFERLTGEDPVAGVAGELGRLWGDASREREIRWPLAMRVGRV